MKGKRSIRQILDSDHVSGYLFILPFIIGFLVFTVFPMLASLVLSFTEYDILSAPEFIGIENYKQLFLKDPPIHILFCSLFS